MIFGSIAVLLVPFPFYPLHDSQTGPQTNKQICVLLLQVASLSDFNRVSVVIFMASSYIRHQFVDIVTYPMSFLVHFDVADPLLAACQSQIDVDSI